MSVCNGSVNQSIHQEFLRQGRGYYIAPPGAGPDISVCEEQSLSGREDRIARFGGPEVSIFCAKKGRVYQATEICTRVQCQAEATQIVDWEPDRTRCQKS